MHILFGKWTENKLDQFLREALAVRDTGERIDLISRQFLETAYKGSTLTGDPQTPEDLVVNLQEVDCFTFLDYVEAMRLSGSFFEFIKNLKKVRYRGGDVAFQNRNHFFTDWLEFNSDMVHDVTEQVGGPGTKSITKILNQKENGSVFLDGVQPAEREIRFIPSGSINEDVISNLQTGDYAGIYSELHGLDVSHAGIIIKNNGPVYLRHASSKSSYHKVIDQDFKHYIYNRPGLIVFRPGNL
ncbi:MAG TPA: DUF1460 domain-containing protein [Nitrospirae bacterium]|nr:hypothetical protein BMS3Abin10_02532 [bacterium BMS3Abin10]GBE38292.1 hypothetical protein BMS3Bbin08_00897 [bacterium BMS3Bbin08]HDH00196.1 DUF1460 domain-containing protein [Nitrospirota bacterium]HDH49788.1 DUF1460 domain-containing protein [Nitrospirota bacterium]